MASGARVIAPSNELHGPQSLISVETCNMPDIDQVRSHDWQTTGQQAGTRMVCGDDHILPVVPLGCGTGSDKQTPSPPIHGSIRCQIDDEGAASCLPCVPVHIVLSYFACSSPFSHFPSVTSFCSLNTSSRSTNALSVTVCSSSTRHAFAVKSFSPLLLTGGLEAQPFLSAAGLAAI